MIALSRFFLKTKSIYPIVLLSTFLWLGCQTEPPSPVPVADFDFDPSVSTFTAPATVRFINRSTDADSYLWTYPGGTSSEKDLTISVSSAGQLTVTLRAIGKGGSDEVTKSFTIVAPAAPVASFTFASDRDLVAPVKVTFTNTSKNADSYLWDFGDGSTSTAENPVKEFTKAGTFKVKLKAIGKLASAEYASDVTVKDPITVISSMPTVDNAVAELMAKYDLPGVSVALILDDKLIYAKGYGMADKEKNVAVRTDHLFRIASISKSVTGVAVFKLIEQGKLSLDALVFGKNGLLGTQYGNQPYGQWIETITVRHLLNHTAGGWGNAVNDPMFATDWLSYSQSQLISEVLNSRPLNTTPGSKYDYSNFGYLVLGRVIEKVTGKSYRDYVRENILVPAGISTMEIGGDTEAERLPNEVVYYNTGFSPYAMKIRRMDAHGGWVASATDLARLLVRVNGFGGKPDILSAASIAKMTEGSAANRNYACGWGVNSANNWWHTGSLPGESSEWIRTSGNLGWVILVNKRSNDNTYFNDLDATFWKAISNVPQWPTQDLF